LSIKLLRLADSLAPTSLRPDLTPPILLSQVPSMSENHPTTLAKPSKPYPDFPL
jgi:hypothetical protein